MFKKKAVISITIFSLLIMLFCLLLAGTYSYYSDSKYLIEEINTKQEILNSISSFRVDLLKLITQNNSNMTYSNSLDPLYIDITLKNTTISGEVLLKKNNVELNMSSLGVLFCDEYTFSPSVETIFSYNDSCVQIIG